MTPDSGYTSFPSVFWGDDHVTFLPGVVTESPVWALVFPFYGDRLVLAQIPGRGWCIPSGRIESGETVEEGARREVWEESGATLSRMALLGTFQLANKTTGKTHYGVVFLGDVANLEDLPEGTESEGRLLIPMEDAENTYFAWDALLAAVFDYAEARRLTLLPAGTSLADFTRSSEL